MRNSNLTKAKKAKNDEFYTQLSDVEKELKYYKEHFKGKIVLCNADDPFESNFFKYFAMNFNHLGLKKFITTCYSDSQLSYTQYSLFEDEPKEEPRRKRKAYKVVITHVEDANDDGSLNMDDILQLVHEEGNSIELLNGDGDFRSDECLEILEEADIVVTNPPFSLFREFIATIEEYNKKYIVLGNMNAITYKEVFPLVKDDKLWLGCTCGDMSFRVPASSEARATRFWEDSSGQKWRSLGNIEWFTNIDHKKRHDSIILHRSYMESLYPKYDNYDAIEVSRLSDIPFDYGDVMGVPITFLDKYNPEQFEIIGCSDNGAIDNAYKIPHFKKHNEPYIKGKKCYKRIFIRNRHPQEATR